MDAGFVESSLSGWTSVPWAIALVIVAFLFFRYLHATAQHRFQAKEANAVREDARKAQARLDRLASEERSAAITAERRQHEREDNAREEEAERARLLALHEEARADPAGNAAAADDCMRILSEADALLVKLCRYYVECDALVDDDDEDADDPYENLGNMAKELRELYSDALKYFSDAQEMVGESLYKAARAHAENCLLETKYVSDRIIALDTNQWNRIQTKVN